MKRLSVNQTETLCSDFERKISSLVSDEISVSVIVDNTKSDELAVVFRNGKTFAQGSVKMQFVDEIDGNADVWRNILVIPLLCDLAKKKWLRK